MEQEVKVKSLVKAMRLLECFSSQKSELGVTEIANILGLHKSTVHNIASTLKELGYLSQNKDNEKYSLGIKLLQFSYIVNNQLGFRKFFLPYMKELANIIHENVYLGIPHENEVLYIECCYPDDINGGRNILGERAPMYCTGLGKAMLAFVSEEKLLEYSNQVFYRFTDNTIQTKKRLFEEIAITKLRGYSIDNMEHEYGVTCIGVPIFGIDSRVVAALSVSGPSLRFDEKTIVRHAAKMRDIISTAQYKL